MPDTDPSSAGALCQRIRDGELRSEELLDALLQRIDAGNPAINAVVALDRDGARAAARQADRERAAGRLRGPLHGLPITIKDAFEVSGVVTACGSPRLQSHRPTTHAPAVQRLADAGALMLGKTNTPLYCGDFQSYNAVYGVTGNPWDLDRTPGGSSGGAAAALAAGMTPLELGSDIGGSLRNPAHFCGVYSHKPGYGLVPMRGHIPGPPGTLSEPDLAVAGPMARHAEDLALMLDLLVEHPDRLPPARPVKRVRTWFDDPACPIDASLKAHYESVAESLQASGFEVVDGPPPGISLEADYALFQRLLAAVVGGGLPEKAHRQMLWAGRLARWFGRDAPDSAGAYAAAATISHRDWLKANELRHRRRRDWDRALADTDVLLMPVTPTTAPPHQHDGNLFSRRIRVNGEPRPYAQQMSWISPATLADLPVTTAPVGLVDGLPAGLQILAPRGQDRTAIAFASELARIHPPPVWPGLTAQS